MSAIAERHIAEFVWQAQLTLAVFGGSTIVAVLARFAEERLGLLWREFMTERCVAAYMASGTYYRLAMSGELANLDQRIAEDRRAFTATTLSFGLMAMNSAFTILAFCRSSGRSAPNCSSSPFSMPRSARIRAAVATSISAITLTSATT
jgi:putative ATP-binding cassette transporter